MADRNALGRIGLILGAATVMVLMMGGFVISDHLNGRLQAEDNLRVSAASAAAVR